MIKIQISFPTKPRRVALAFHFRITSAEVRWPMKSLRGPNISIRGHRRIRPAAT